MNRRNVLTQSAALVTAISLPTIVSASPLVIARAAIWLANRVLAPTAIAVIVPRIEAAQVRPASPAKNFHEEFASPELLLLDVNSANICTRQFGINGLVSYSPREVFHMADFNRREIEMVIAPETYQRFGCVPFPCSSRLPVNSSQENQEAKRLAWQKAGVHPDDAVIKYKRQFTGNNSSGSTAYAVQNIRNANDNRVIFA